MPARPIPVTRLEYTCTRLNSEKSSTVRGGASLMILPQEVHSTVKEASRVRVVGLTCTLPLQVAFGHFCLETIAWSCSSEITYLLLKCPCGSGIISCIIFIRFWWEDGVFSALDASWLEAELGPGVAGTARLQAAGAGVAGRGEASWVVVGSARVEVTVSGGRRADNAWCVRLTFSARILSARPFFHFFTFPMVL